MSRDYQVIKVIRESDSYIIEKRTKDFYGRKLITKEEYNANAPVTWDGPEIMKALDNLAKKEALSKSKPKAKVSGESKTEVNKSS